MTKSILIYGATDRTGQLIIEYALQNNYKVKALVRNPDKIIIKSDNFSIIKGNPTNIDNTRKAMPGL